jgi:GH24 family phage-related lysozyme (muramidase)
MTKLIFPFSDGYGNPTLAFGHLIHAGENLSNGITLQQAIDLLHSDLSGSEQDVKTLIRISLTQGMFNVLTDIAFRAGIGNFERSRIYRYMKVGNYKTAGAEQVWGQFSYAFNKNSGLSDWSLGLARRSYDD